MVVFRVLLFVLWFYTNAVFGSFSWHYLCWGVFRSRIASLPCLSMDLHSTMRKWREQSHVSRISCVRLYSHREASSLRLGSTCWTLPLLTQMSDAVRHSSKFDPCGAFGVLAVPVIADLKSGRENVLVQTVLQHQRLVKLHPTQLSVIPMFLTYETFNMLTSTIDWARLLQSICVESRKR